MNLLPLFDAFFAPSRCVLCRKRIATGDWCEPCAAATKTSAKTCYRCGSARQTHHACWPDGSAVGATVVAYDDSLGLRRVLTAAVRHGVQSVFDDAARLLASRYLVRESRPTVVCAVPLAKRALRTQSFDQRAVLAKMFAQSANLAVGPRLSRTKSQANYRPDSLALDDKFVVLVTDVIGDEALSAAVRFCDAHNVRRVDVVAVVRYGDDSLDASQP